MVEQTQAPKRNYEIITEGSEEILKLNYEAVPFSPSVEDSAECMVDAIEKLSENPSVSKVTFSQRRNYTYDFDQTQMLVEIAQIYGQLAKRKRAISMEAMGTGAEPEEVLARRYEQVNNVVFNLLKSDPLGAYVELKRKIRTEHALQKQVRGQQLIDSSNTYLSVLAEISSLLEGTKLVSAAKPYLAGYQLGDRSVYKAIFKPAISPNFMYSRLIMSPPMGGKQLAMYNVDGNTEVAVYSVPGDVKYMYHITPPEFKLTEDKYALVDLARSVLAEHKPREEEFLDPQKLRVTFTNIGSDLLRELAEHQGLDLTNEEIKELSEILVRNTIGFGIVELLLKDDNVQDININSPMGQVPIFLLHSEFNECFTNVTPSTSDFESWGSKFRLLSGRPLDEANPILDTELSIPGARARVSIINKPLNPYGLAFAYRRHRDKPWTLPLFIKTRMLNPMAAGLISFLIQGSRTMLVAGTRSSGKTSLLGSCLVEIMRKYRIITIEDSVSGEAKVLFKENGKFYSSNIKDLFSSLARHNKIESIGGRDIMHPKGISVLSVSDNGKVLWKQATMLMRHKVKKPLYEVITATGRRIEITGDHSIFCLADTIGKIIREEKISDLVIGDRIAVPRKLSFPESKSLVFNGLEAIKGMDLSKQDLRKIFVKVGNKWLGRYKPRIKKVGKALGYAKPSIDAWLRKSWIPFAVLSKLHVAASDLLEFKYGGNSVGIPINIKLDRQLMAFLGLWTADGCFDHTSVILSVSSIEERSLVKEIAGRFGFVTRMHSDGFSLMIHSHSLKFLLARMFAMEGNAYTKRIPVWIMRLKKDLKAAFLKGLFSGDGCVSDKEIIISLASKSLLDDIQTMLLNFGIVFRINRMRLKKFNPNDRTTDGRISEQRSICVFHKEIGFLQERKNKKLVALTKRLSTHGSSDTVFFSHEVLEKLKSYPRAVFNKQDYMVRRNGIGLIKLKEIAKFARKKGDKSLAGYLEMIANSDILWDKIVSIKRVNKADNYVFDISVPGVENFIVNNVLAHNTLELPTDALRNLGYNIQPLKVRSALTKGGTELEASEGIRTSLRLGDSALIVGEVRSSLRGDEEVVIVDNGVTKRVAIKDIEKLDLKLVYVPTLTNENKVELKKLSGFVKHPKRSQLIKLTTKTGRSVVVTPDHSVFTNVNFKIAAINTDQLKNGDSIIIPSKLPNSFNDISYFDLLGVFKDDYRLEGAEPYIRKAIKVLTWKKASKITGICDIYRYLLSTQKTRIPINSFLELMKTSGVKYDLGDLRIKRGTSNSIPAKFPINENTLRLIGYYLSEGNLGKNGIQITNSKPEIIADVMDICQKEFGIKVNRRTVKGLGTSIQMLIQSKPLSDLLVYLGCGRTSFHKRIPEFVYGLSESKICALLRGMYSGDGSFSSTKSAGNMVRYYSTAKKLVEDVSYALLSIGIVCRLIKRPPAKLSKKDCFIAEIKQRKYVKKFLGAVGFTHKKPEMASKAFSHSTDDSVYFDPRELEKHLKLPRKYRHLRRTKCCSKDYLKIVTGEVKCSDEIYGFAHGDFFIDKVKSLEVINLPEAEYVYDLSVASTQRFIGGFAGILLHNTEAIALYEAMRVGALANVVAGTIHGDSPYGVFDRVVNDLGVPRTSFKATDIIIVANPLKSPDGMHKWRRVTQITEVRKTWEEDPLEERGFVDLMKYNAKTDELEPTPDLINGDSEVLKSIGANVKEWTGNWDAIWENIMLRAKSKEAIVRYSDETKDPELLEAPFVIRSNDQMQRISEEVRDEVGELDNKMVYERWESWLKKVIRDKNY